MNYVLRQFQAEARDAAIACLTDGRGKNGLIVLPTGAGKSVCWAAIAEKMDAHFLLFQPSKEILEQNLSKFHAFGYRPGVYCLEVGERVLTADLRWVPCGSLRVGDRIFAFDESNSGEASRRWRFAEVTMSEPAMAECVRVHLEDGTSVVTTLNHPWLINPGIKRNKSRRWVESKDLMNGRRLPGWAGRHQPSRGYHVLRALRPWLPYDTYEAGWLAGIYDGEGSISASSSNGSRISIAQNQGSVLECIERGLRRYGFVFDKNWSKYSHVANLRIQGGYREQLRFLGSIRPTRLLTDWERKWLPRRLMNLEKVQAVEIEPVGLRMVQQVTTTAGTYIGEGFLMHNSASMGRKSVGQITLATIGSVKNKAHLFSDFDFIGVDECDLTNAKSGQYKNFFNDIKLPMIGMTATPYRLSSDMNGTILKFLTRTRPRIWHELIYYAQNKDLFDEGYLAKLEYHTVKGFNRHKLRDNSTGADYTDKSVQLHMYEINFKDKIVKVVERLKAIGRKNALIFTRFVEEAQYVASKVPGIVVVTADTPKAEREAIGKEFRAGRIWGVVNVGIYTVGFDYPELETVVLTRITKSLRLYYQMVGRIMRPHPDKEFGMVVDLVGLVEQFGKVEDLTIVDGGNGKWFIASNDRPLTNVYFGDSGGSRCRECGMSISFWARHERTGNSAPIQRPPAGIPANIAIHSKEGKTLYSVVKPGEGEFLVHYSVCRQQQQQMRATG